MSNTNTAQHTHPENTVPSDQQTPHHQSLSAAPASDMDVAITERAIANLLLKKRIKGAMVDIHITLDDYLKECEKVWDRTVTPGTKILYRSTINYHILPFFTGTRIINWGRPDIRGFLERLDNTIALDRMGNPFKDGRKLSSNVKRRILAVLSAICSLAKGDGIIDENPVKDYGITLKRYGSGVIRAKPIRMSKALTLEERDRVLTAARLVLNLQYYTLFVIMAGTGLRPSEACALRWKHFDLDGVHNHGVPTLTVLGTFRRGEKKPGLPKSKKARTVVLDATIVALLKAIKATVPDQPTAFVFVKPNGKPVTQAFRTTLWAFVFGVAGMSRWLSLYCLRHTYASILINQGGSITLVSEQLGHWDDEVTRTVYHHWLPIKSKDHLSLLRLNRAVVPPAYRPMAPQPPAPTHLRVVPPLAKSA